MDYNVRYNIDINGAQASKSISDFPKHDTENHPSHHIKFRNLEKGTGKDQLRFRQF